MIAVTGGAGFIGSAVIHALNQRGMNDILAVDHLGTSSKWKNLRGLSFADYREKDDFMAQVSFGLTSRARRRNPHGGLLFNNTSGWQLTSSGNNFQYTKDLALFVPIKASGSFMHHRQRLTVTV